MVKRTPARGDELVDAATLSLDEWLQLMRLPEQDRRFVRNRFPTDGHRKEFLDRVAQFAESDVRLVLRNFIVCTGSNLIDEWSVEGVVDRLATGQVTMDTLWEHERRLLRFHATGSYPVWEGLHWILDLLPHHPRQALTVVEAFFAARCQFLNDGYLVGLSDASEIIRQRFVVSAGTVAGAAGTMASLHWRELEWLVGALYRAMGFHVVVTPRSGDDGIDVIATGTFRGHPSQLVVQVKHWTNGRRIEKPDVRELLGAVDSARATGGVIVTSGGVRSGARDMGTLDRRVQVIDGPELLRLLNEHCGTDWYLRITHLLATTKSSL